MSPDLHHLNNQWASTEPHREAADMSWQEQGACRGMDPDLWFPDRGESSVEGKRICREQCPVRFECLEYALEAHERGLWGGYSERERRRMRESPSKRKPINHGTEGGYQAHVRRGVPVCHACNEARSQAVKIRRQDKAALGPPSLAGWSDAAARALGVGFPSQLKGPRGA
jgi:WhiB family redox-sensing transcriptional regulator